MIAMDLQNLIEQAFDDVFEKYSWEAIEFLFRPTNHLELFLRINFDGTVAWLKDLGYYPHNAYVKTTIEMEHFYRSLAAEYEKRLADDNET